jgi:hypothetical protein
MAAYALGIVFGFEVPFDDRDTVLITKRLDGGFEYDVFPAPGDDIRLMATTAWALKCSRLCRAV